jgi:hypothetical protein
MYFVRYIIKGILSIFIKARAKKTGPIITVAIIATTAEKRVKAIKMKNPPMPIQAA